MDETIKSRFILILSVVALIFIVGGIGSCASGIRYRSERDKEMYKRLNLEEKSEKLTQEKTEIETRLNKADKELAEVKTILEQTQKELQQEQIVNKSLKDELLKISQSKGCLK